MREVIIRVNLLATGGEFDLALDADAPNDAWMLNIFNQRLCYEPEVVHVMSRAVRLGDICVDVGANVGFFTLLLAKLVGDGGHVTALEPGRNILARLKQNISRNNVTNVVLIEQPAWNKREKIKFHLNADSTGGNAIWDPGLWEANEMSRANPQSYEIEAVALDDFVVPSTRLIKIDTEGAEQRVLEGMEHALKFYHPPFIIAELAPFGLETLGCSGNSMREYMHEFDYETFLIHPDGSLPSLVPPQTEITYLNGQVVMNVLFSTVDDVGKIWTKVPYAD